MEKPEPAMADFYRIMDTLTFEHAPNLLATDVRALAAETAAEVANISKERFPFAVKDFDAIEQKAGSEETPLSDIFLQFVKNPHDAFSKDDEKIIGWASNRTRVAMASRKFRREFKERFPERIFDTYRFRATEEYLQGGHLTGMIVERYLIEHPLD